MTQEQQQNVRGRRNVESYNSVEVMGVNGCKWMQMAWHLSFGASQIACPVLLPWDPGGTQ